MTANVVGFFLNLAGMRTATSAIHFCYNFCIIMKTIPLCKVQMARNTRVSWMFQPALHYQTFKYYNRTCTNISVFSYLLTLAFKHEY
jgi:hypothetical protein